ncbi:MAG: metallopeptidase family protein [Mariprofundaceae bacterium]
MNAEEFRQCAEDTYAALPEHFLRAIHNVAVITEDEPGDDILQQMECERHDLLGLYQGWPLPERGASYGGSLPDMIHLYRLPILAYCATTGEDVRHCVRHVMVHEIGHYFGFSDEAMEAIECQS